MPVAFAPHLLAAALILDAALLFVFYRKVSHKMSAVSDRVVAAAQAVVVKFKDLEASNVTLTAQVATLTEQVSQLTAEAGTSDATLEPVAVELEGLLAPPAAPAVTPDPNAAPAS